MKIALCLILFSQLAGAYLYSEVSGKKLKWNLRNNFLNIYADPADTNATGIDSLDVKAALEESLSEWNASAPISLRPVYTSSPPAFGSGASFRFSSNPAFFGAGVLAVTSVGYNSSTGSIYSADIVMNDSFYSPTNFTALKTESSGSQAYLGDVISHEIGHLLGLNHSEVGQSSMIFSIFKGQYSPHSDDIKGLQDLYSTSHFRGIKGKVVGENMAPVFGAHVQAIDVESNQVAAGVFSDEQGNFYFKGLEANKSYALYMNPIRSKENLPEYYSTFQANFCDGNSFQPSFFSKCGGRNLGRAQIIKVDSNSVVNVGNFTVKCSTSAHPEYLRQKLIADEDSFYTAMDYLDDYKTHATFTGYFSQNDLNKEEDGKGDRIRLDLSGLDVSSLPSTRVQISVSTEKLGTAAGAVIYSHRADQDSAVRHSFGTEPLTGKLELDFSFSLALSSDSDDNIFDLSVFPYVPSQSEKVAIFASPNLLTNKTAIYFLAIEVQAQESWEFFPLQARDDYPYQDNSNCLEGATRQTASAYNPILSSDNEGLEQNQSVSCATIDLGSGGPPGGGMASFLAGICLSAFFVALRGRRDDFFV